MPRDRPRGPRAVPFRGVRGAGFEPRMPDVSNSGLVCRYVAFPHIYGGSYITCVMRLLSVRVTTDDKKGSDERREGINETRQGADMVHGTTVLHDYMLHVHVHVHVTCACTCTCMHVHVMWLRSIVKSAKVPPTPSAYVYNPPAARGVDTQRYVLI